MGNEAFGREAGQGRREFVKTAAAAGLLILRPETVFGSQANSAVEVGLIGCGGRGNWISPFFPEYTGARIVALADRQVVDHAIHAGGFINDLDRGVHLRLIGHVPLEPSRAVLKFHRHAVIVHFSAVTEVLSDLVRNFLIARQSERGRQDDHKTNE